VSDPSRSCVILPITRPHALSPPAQRLRLLSTTRRGRLFGREPPPLDRYRPDSADRSWPL